MGQPVKTGHGPDPGARGRARLAIVYGCALLALAAFGAGRLWEFFPRIAAGYAALRYNLDVSARTRAAFAEALRSNARVPQPDPSVPHQASYPVLAQRLHQQGQVILKVLVLPSGQVGDVQVLQSSGFAQLDAAALTGVGDWHYVPAVRDHRPVSAWIRVNIRFRDESDPPANGP